MTTGRVATGRAATGRAATGRDATGRDATGRDADGRVGSGRVAVIGGGTSCEHEVSLASAAGVVRALASIGYEVESLTIDRRGTWRTADGRALGLAEVVEALQSCDVVVPMLHGIGGEDGTLAALCELAGVPYVGSGVRAGAVAMDKWVTKLVAEATGVRTACGTLVRRGDPRQIADLLVADLPMVVKPVSAGSSHGVSLVRTPDQLVAALEAAFVLDDRVLVEEVIAGREIDIAVLGRPDGTRMVAPALEILAPASGIFDLATKYDGSARFLVPAPLPEARRKDLEEAAIAIYDALGCAGVARIDFFLTDTGPLLNEVNTTPGFTEHSQVPRMFAAAGIGYADLLDLLVTDARAAGPARVMG
ncbi:MAG: D-alanine--D-alanine ligase [Micromonosporaceae bacterium]|nr:D-alanine--D-alanine ligase [Micromonosporaceae bacterium]